MDVFMIIFARVESPKAERLESVQTSVFHPKRIITVSFENTVPWRG